MNDSGNAQHLNHVTTYLTDLALLGPKQITAPNGLKTFFDYDSYGRLLRIEDHQNKILEEYAYHIQPGNTFVDQRLPRVALTNTSGASTSAMETIRTYYDGLGRPLQKVHINAQPGTSGSIITDAITYDNFDRVINSYVPFAASGSGLATLPTSVHGDSNPYSANVLFDHSPLDRIKKQLGPGNAWHSQDKSIQTSYEVASASIRRYFLNTSSSVSYSSSYPANALAKRMRISEEGNRTTQYFDNEGKLIQVTQELNSTENATTHYIYDQRNRVRNIIQPTKAALSPQSFTEGSGSYFTGGVYAYKYDSRGRVRQSHEPGGGWTSFVYDRLNRQVLSQNALQATEGKWTYSKYDAFGRVIQTGELTTTKDRITLQNEFDAITQAFEQWNTGSKSYSNVSFPSGLNQTVRNQFYYDVYDIGPAPIVSFDGSETNQSRHTSARGLLTWSFAHDSDDNATAYHRVHYYDYRDRLIQTVERHILGDNSNPMRVSFSYNFTNQVTQESQIFNFDDLSTEKLVETYSYDHKGRPITYGAGMNATPAQICTTSYDAVGRLIQKVYYPGQSFTAGGAIDQIVRPPNPDGPHVTDVARRAVILQPGTEINLPETPYTADIQPGPDPNNITGLQTIDYHYNIRDWLTGINLNGSNPTPNGNQGDLFSMKLVYGRYDGQITQHQWQVAADLTASPPLRTYNYTYDKASRLTQASYTATGENHSVPMVAYDPNGNITALQRHGGTSSLVDDLSYTYSGNHLMRVEDAMPGDHQTDFVNRNNGSDDYAYYADGCLKLDLNENIQEILYDTYLGKPKRLDLTTGEWITYTYSSDGTLINRTLSDGTTWDYVGKMILKNGAPYHISTSEGRSVYEEATWHWEFAYRDHVGNLRVGFRERDGSLQKTQISDYTPFGVPFHAENFTINKQTFTYHNHEEQPDFGLRMTNMQARCYNQTIGKFLAVDPLADEPHNVPLSPYHYVANNPINNIDPFGLDWYRNNEIGDVHWQQGSDDLENHTNIGAEYILEGTKDFIVHNQNDVVATIAKSSLESVDQNSVMAGALAASAVLVADDASVVGIVDDIAIPVILAGAATYELTQRTFVTYTLNNPALGQVYSGRASGYGDPYSIMLARYMRHHKRAEGFGFPALDRAVQGYQGRPAIRGREQQLIDFHGRAQSEGGTSGNRIRGVSKRNIFGRIYHNASNLYFGPLSPYTGY